MELNQLTKRNPNLRFWPIFLALTSEEPYISECLCLCMRLRMPFWQKSSILTLELNNSAPDHLIELKFGILNHLRMYIMMLMSEGCPGVSLRVPWGWLWEYSEITLKVLFGSLWGWTGVTLRIPWEHFGGTFEDTLGVTLGVLRNYFEGTLGDTLGGYPWGLLPTFCHLNCWTRSEL